MTVTAEDVRVAARLCRMTLEPLVEADWSARAGSLEWDCRQTVAHISDALGFYAVHLASRATGWLKFDVVPHGDATNLHLARLVDATGELLSQVVEAAPSEARAFHHSGMWDKHGFAAMGCLEALVHMGDVAAGLQVTFEPPDALCRRLVDHLFVGAPSDENSWAVLWWATGRGELPQRTRLGADWEAYWLKRMDR